MMMRTLLIGLASVLIAACSGGQKTMDKYIPWDADAKGIQTTETGLQYIVVREGPKSGARPTVEDKVRVMYEGRLTDGTVFDSSYERNAPAQFGVGQVIPGWTEGLQLMTEGDEFIFFIPTDIGYGQFPRPGGLIKPGDDLLFRVELLNIVEPKFTDAEAWAKYTPWDSANEGVQKTDSGLEYVILADGDAAGTTPNPTDQVVVYYEGRLAETGEVFDSAYQRGEPIMFPANGVIPGWVEALSMMKPGDRWLVHIPSDLAYGPRGHPAGIAPNADLNFEVELVDVVPVR